MKSAASKSAIHNVVIKVVDTVVILGSTETTVLQMDERLACGKDQHAMVLLSREKELGNVSSPGGEFKGFELCASIVGKYSVDCVHSAFHGHKAIGCDSGWEKAWFEGLAIVGALHEELVESGSISLSEGSMVMEVKWMDHLDASTEELRLE